ncbi:LutB/LldF family L-lactate oxidation iron-sulfur protein [Quatrionicoccus australiensis]|uniref:LutB/LldF family L-lactate oxidation iron-sulfur protein n=1 Tax=Quatrionicoccus australiensis TaxID=138118 RepID=UPI001CFA1C92|nr:LutB/LldF family L-lactate oxidation iron-sulfur protein [Quatrionicoccus australiensis]MCB4359342.1 iron-sulfur cluster-binding protein [Quatrionicoccus australiensis]
MAGAKHSQAMFFQARAGEKIRNKVLQKALQKAKPLFVGKRAKAMAALPEDGFEFEALRSACVDIRNRVLGDLDVWLELFEEKAKATGAEVLWARDGDEICELVIDVARRHGVTKATKSKSMLSEEAHLNEALAAAGIRPVETDLGEYIIQLAGETPSHIIAPAVHKTIEEVEALFAEEHGRPLETRTSADIPAMTREAREVLRQHFLSAEMGITGANFLIAETGSAALVTNEGNGRMVTTLPRVHVVVTGIEKIVPTLDDFATLMRLLPRSATGQTISNYVSLLTGTKQPGDSDGPEKTVFILVDNGRANLLGSAYQEMLRCIRCGACMNHCPVYFSLGGHAYGWVYPGPMGSVLTPLYTGIENALDLPHASTGCNQCGTVCPVRIPLPGLMHRLREEQVERGLRPLGESFALKAWAWLAGKPRLYRWVVRRASRYLNWLADDSGRIRILGMAPGWTAGRDLSVPAGKTFHEQYAARKRA